LKQAEERYIERIERYQSLISEQTRIINLISNIRLIVFTIGAGLGIYLYVKKSYGLVVFDIILFSALFIALMVFHERYFNKKKHSITLLKINEDSLKRIHGEWNTFTDDGEEFIDDSHPYSQDLDIFGKSSLFQFINTASTYLGRLELRDLLTSPTKRVEEISARQEAVIDLAQRLDWRQKYMAEGMNHSKMLDPEALFSWASSMERFYRKPLVIFALRLIPIITIVIGISAYIDPEPRYYSLIAMLLIQFIILRINAKKRVRALEVASKYMANVKAYDKMLGVLEKEQYNSPYLESLKNSLKVDKGQTAGEQIQKLVKIVDGISNRHSLFYVLFNILFLLDYQFIFELEKWKEKSGGNLKNWLYTIGKFEGLASLAVLQHDYPEWTMPELSEGIPSFTAEEMGHPLLANSSVANDLKFEFPENILLITGSNMSGKSTLLRTSGINLVLAYAGTVVCAKMFRCSLMEIYTCMRVSDNLEKNISSFYAELLRIKMIVKAVEEGENIFFLLDEIFKGTNSIDRHTGAKALIKKLSQEKTLGLISTHDLELGDLEKESDKVRNYHFQEYYENDEIHFDFKLRPGVSKTRNAEFLMKMAGIEFSAE